MHEEIAAACDVLQAFELAFAGVAGPGNLDRLHIFGLTQVQVPQTVTIIEQRGRKEQRECGCESDLKRFG